MCGAWEFVIFMVRMIKRNFFIKNALQIKVLLFSLVNFVSVGLCILCMKTKTLLCELGARYAP